VSLLESHSRNDTAVKSGISVSTLERWLKDSEFQTLLREAEKNKYQEISSKSMMLLDQSLDTLGRNLNCGVPSQEIRAAAAVCEVHSRLVEIYKFEKRLASLESSVGDTP